MGIITYNDKSFLMDVHPQQKIFSISAICPKKGVYIRK